MLIERQRILVPSNYPFDKGYVQGNYSYVYAHATLFEKYILDTMRGDRETRYLWAKIRCSVVGEGEFPCVNPNWHFDLFKDDDGEEPRESHYLWVSSIPPIFQGPTVIDPERLYWYQRDKHRASRAVRTGPRLFIRVSYCNTRRLGDQNLGR